MSQLRAAWRSLRRDPGFASAVILTLGLGIGAVTAAFSLVHGVLLSPLPSQDDRALVLVEQRATKTDLNPSFSIREFLDLRETSSSFTEVAEYHSMSFTLLGRNEPERVRTGVVSAGFFDLLGLVPLRGRAFVPADEEHGAEAVLMLSHEYWQRGFGGDPEIVGQVFEMNDRPHTVVGILPPVPQFPRQNDVYMPTSACPFRAMGQERMDENRRAFANLTVLARLAPGRGLEEARAELESLAQRFATDHPEIYREELGFTMTALALREELTREARPTLWVLFATTVFVLLIACANVANLHVARRLRREREVAVRVALGAGRAHLLRQHLAESLLLALLGGGLGLFLAFAGFDLLQSFVARFTPRAVDVAIDGQVLAFSFALAVTAAVLSSLMAGLSLPGRLVSALHEGGRSTAGASRQRLRAVLVTAQVAVSVALLVGAGLMLRSLERLERVDPGFVPESLLSARVSLNWSNFNDFEDGLRFFNELLGRLATRPGVISAAASSQLPVGVEGPSNTTFAIEGRALEPGEIEPVLDFRSATPGYFETVGIPVFQGRAFRPGDDAEAMRVAVINRGLARRYWSGSDPLGARVSLDGGTNWLTIVGVVGDVRDYGPAAPSTEQLYIPYAQGGFVQYVLLRSQGDPRSAVAALKEEVWALEPEQPVTDVAPLDTLRRASTASPRLTSILLGIFALLALLITAAGILGVVAFSVSQRRQEIGVRMALGARRSAVLAMVLRQGLSLVAGGLVLGIVGAFLWGRELWENDPYGRAFAGLLFEIQPGDPLTLIVVSLVLLLVTAAACLIPARRAAGVDPTVALRSD